MSADVNGPTAGDPRRGRIGEQVCEMALTGRIPMTFVLSLWLFKVIFVALFGHIGPTHPVGPIPDLFPLEVAVLTTCQKAAPIGIWTGRCKSVASVVSSRRAAGRSAPARPRRRGR